MFILGKHIRTTRLSKYVVKLKGINRYQTLFEVVYGLTRDHIWLDKIKGSKPGDILFFIGSPHNYQKSSGETQQGYRVLSTINLTRNYQNLRNVLWKRPTNIFRKLEHWYYIQRKKFISKLLWKSI